MHFKEDAIRFRDIKSKSRVSIEPLESHYVSQWEPLSCLLREHHFGLSKPKTLEPFWPQKIWVQVLPNVSITVSNSLNVDKDIHEWDGLCLRISRVTFVV